MIEEIFRKYLEIKSIDDLNEAKKPSSIYSLNLIQTKDFQLNKFLYKNIGKKNDFRKLLSEKIKYRLEKEFKKEMKELE